MGNSFVSDKAEVEAAPTIEPSMRVPDVRVPDIVGFRDVSGGKYKKRNFPGDKPLPNGWHSSADKCSNKIELD